MGANLYQEAIAEARKLREVAEQNAKNRIIEAVTPKIRMLIEKELNDEDLEWEDEESDDSEWEEGSDLEDLDLLEPIEPTESPGIADELVDLEADKDARVTVNIKVESDHDEIYEVSKNALNRLGAKQYKLAKNRTGWLVAKLKEAKTVSRRKKILAELTSLQSDVIVNISTDAGLKLAKSIENIIKENKTMSRRTRRGRRLNENAWWLNEVEGEEEDFEGEEDIDLEDEDLDLEDEEGEGLPAEEMELSDLLALASEKAEELEGGEEEELDLDMEDEEFEDEEDLELEDEPIEDAHVLEISESMLRRELARMNAGRRRSRRNRISETRRGAPSRRRRRPVSRRRRMFEGEAKAMASSFGGGKLGKEMFVEVDENTLLNAFAEELGGAHKLKMAGGSPTKGSGVSSFGGGSIKKGVVPESYRRRQRKLARKAQLSERRARSAQKELKESNLFNAKLLYVNKLMQQHDLNAKQQRAIVEALDNAKTLREAKLLYTSLTESLRRRRNASGSRNLSEGLVRSGSPSRSTQSAQPAKSGVELNRWAVLAGINKPE